MNKTKNLVYLIGYIFLLMLLVTFWYVWVDPALKTIKNNLVLLECLYVIGKLLIMVIPVLMYLKYIDKGNPFEYLKLKTNKTNGIKWGIIIGLGFIIYLLIRGFLSGVININFNIGIYYWIGGLLVGFVEEVPFRGFLLQKLQECFGFWKANLITALIFVLYHYPKLIYQSSKGILMNSILILILGLIFGYTFKKSKSLWTVIIAHSLFDLAGWIIFGVS
jgi:uncharacterized protein